jgi:hypothetical protein
MNEEDKLILFYIIIIILILICCRCFKGYNFHSTPITPTVTV